MLCFKMSTIHGLILPAMGRLYVCVDMYACDTNNAIFDKGQAKQTQNVRHDMHFMRKQKPSAKIEQNRTEKKMEKQ